MCNNVECARYFKQQGAYGRCFLELRKKWHSYGRAAGKIVLKNATDEECRAIGGIIGKTFWDGRISFSFAEFEAGLQKTRFAPVDMKELLECYFGEPMLTNQERREEIRQKKEQFLVGLCTYFSAEYGEASMAFQWLREVKDTGKYGCQLILREYAQNAVQALSLVKYTGLALMKLKPERGMTEGYQCGSGCPLAVFAADVSGNPHYFDRGAPAGQLLIHALCFCLKREIPQSAHGWRELLLDAGIVPDNVSSMIHAYGLRLLTADGIHPAYDAFCSLREPFVITMENMKGITGVFTSGSQVFVVENEMVFSYLVEHVREQGATVLCTSGQPRSVALELIPMILAAGATVCYSGDLDPEGIDIADRLWQKYGDGICIWRMAPEDYAQSLSDEPLSDMRLAKLFHIQHPRLKETAACMVERRCAGYQENLLEELVRDVLLGVPFCATM